MLTLAFNIWNCVYLWTKAMKKLTLNLIKEDSSQCLKILSKYTVKKTKIVSPFLAWSDFHALAFRSLYYPWGKIPISMIFGILNEKSSNVQKMLFIFLQKRLRYQFLVTEALGKNTLVYRRHSASLPRSRFLDVTQRSTKAGSCPLFVCQLSQKC